jgi:hypothetical protein
MPVMCPLKGKLMAMVMMDNPEILRKIEILRLLFKSKKKLMWKFSKQSLKNIKI